MTVPMPRVLGYADRLSVAPGEEIRLTLNVLRRFLDPAPFATP